MPEEQKPVTKTGILEEEPGQTSSMRVMSFTVILTVIAVFVVSNVIMFIKSLKGAPVAMVDFSPYALAALLSALAAKGGQKVVENMEKIGDIVNKIKGGS